MVDEELNARFDQVLREIAETRKDLRADKVTFEEVLMIGGDKPKVGSPTINGATVSATILRESRGDKIVVFRKKRRKNHTKRTHGHRQDMVELRIDSIKG
ncbi:MAG: 50S ribosomal protein L21 [Acidobacteria bacterium]|nr:MAG: 50S ribosomal protein L21 [Acidobacteriota bacterium]